MFDELYMAPVAKQPLFCTFGPASPPALPAASAEIGEFWRVPASPARRRLHGKASLEVTALYASTAPGSTTSKSMSYCLLWSRRDGGGSAFVTLQEQRAALKCADARAAVAARPARMVNKWQRPAQTMRQCGRWIQTETRCTIDVCAASP